jgi:hypothetical protein
VKSDVATSINSGILFSLFDPEEEGNMFPRNINAFQRTTQPYIPEDSTFICRIIQDLKKLAVIGASSF